MNKPDLHDEQELVASARAGEAGAFARLVTPLQPRLQAFALRMLAHPDDAAEMVQESLLKAHRSLDSFRGGSRFSTWLYSILTRSCLDHLRNKKRWHPHALAHAREDPRAPHAEVAQVLSDPSLRFEAREHLSFCFSCVARSLPPQESAALLLRDLFSFLNKEAAEACGISESVLRHRLGAARAAMRENYEGLCGLVSKQGLCQQCAGFRERCREGARGSQLPQFQESAEVAYEQRLLVIRQRGDRSATRADEGGMQPLHDLLYRVLSELEG